MPVLDIEQVFKLIQKDSIHLFLPSGTLFVDTSSENTVHIKAGVAEKSLAF
jgi:hypothetical protein